MAVHPRQHDEPWDTAVLVEGDALGLSGSGIQIPVADVHDGVVFDERRNAG